MNGEDLTLGSPFLEKLNTCCSRLFADMLSLYLRRSGLTQASLAEDVHVTGPAVTHWLQGTRIPESDVLFLILKVLNLSTLERRILLEAWRISCRYRRMIPFIKKAAQEGSIIEIVIDLEDLLSEAKKTIGKGMESQHSRLHEPDSYSVQERLDHDMWLYSNF